MLGHRPLNAEDYLAILKRRWWIIGIPAIVMPVLAVAATLYIPAQYVSMSTVQIGQQKVSSNLVPAVVTEDINSELVSINEQIQSRSKIEPIIEKFNLYAEQHLSMDDRIALARKNLKIEAVQSDLARSSGLPGFTISFIASDAHTAQLVCAELTSLFTRADLSSRQDTAEGTNAFFREQLDNAKHDLDDQDAKLADFQRKHFGMMPDDEANNINILSSLQTQLEASTQALSRMEQDKALLQAMLTEQAAASPNSTSPQTQEQELQNLYAQQTTLTSQYTAEYPGVIENNRKIADLKRKMAQSPAAAASGASSNVSGSNDSAAVQDLRARIRAADIGLQAKRAEQAQITRQIRECQARIQSTPEVEEQYKELTRDTQTSQALYDSILGKLHEAEMANDLQNRQEGETFSLLDPANLPDSRTYPKRRVFASGGLGAGLALGLLFSALLEYRNTALRTERDVWAFTKLPTLAVIAWSGDVAEGKPGRLAWLKWPFRRKPAKDTIADATG